MRLWHKDIIDVLPKDILLKQWGWCCTLAFHLGYENEVKYPAVRKMRDYPNDHFYEYTELVISEMRKRGYIVRTSEFWRYLPLIDTFTYNEDKLFSDWHNDRYLKQCYYNLQEMYDYGAINNEEWKLIEEKVKI